MAMFSIEEARALLPAVRERAEDVIGLRAALAEGQLAVQRGGAPPDGLAEHKAREAHLQAAIDWFVEQGIQVKGVAPLLADFPSTLDGRAVLLCWLEGESALEWYHPVELGFAGRRRLPH